MATRQARSDGRTYRLLTEMTGFAPGPRGGRRRTILGSDHDSDRGARLAILALYRDVYEALGDAGAADLAVMEREIVSALDSASPTHRRAVRAMLSRMAHANIRGRASRARWIVGELLRVVGVEPWSGPPARRRIALADQRLRRLLDAGDPARLSDAATKRARRRAEKLGVRSWTSLARVAPDLYLAMLDSEARPLPRAARVYLVLRPRCKDGSREIEQVFDPDADTGQGKARSLVRAWARDRARTDSQRALAGIFLSRRSK